MNISDLQARVTTALNARGFQLDPVPVQDGEAALWDIYDPNRKLMGRFRAFAESRDAVAVLLDALASDEWDHMCKLLAEAFHYDEYQRTAHVSPVIYCTLKASPETVAECWLRVAGGGEGEG